MFRGSLKTLLVIVVLTCWSAATAHCSLEALGFIPSETSSTEDGCCIPSDGCVGDACEIVEDGSFAQPQDDLKAPAPALTMLLCLSCVHDALAEAPALETPPPAFTAAKHPPTWMPTRHVIRRTAFPVRAPSDLV